MPAGKIEIKSNKKKAVKVAGGDKPFKNMSTAEMSTLIHELHNQQVELELQNEALRKDEQEKIAILDSLVEHVVYQDKEMKILWANKAACESAHLKPEDLLGRNCHEVWADRRTPCEDCPVLKARETGQSQMVEKMTPDGRWWQIKGHPVRDRNGHVTGMTELTLEITERKRAEEAVRKVNDELGINVTKRTAELVEANKRLGQEVEEHRQAEEALRASEEKYRALADNITIGIALISPNMEVLAVNQQLRKWFPNIQIDQKPLCYQAFFDPPREGVCTYCQAIQTFQDGQVHEVEMQLPSGDEIRSFRIISSPVKDAAGKVVAGIEMVDDVTDRLRIQQELEESERRFKSIFENSPIGFYRTTPDGRILDANPALIQMLGCASFEDLAAVNLETPGYQPRYSRRQFRERIERDGLIKGLESLWKKPDDTLVCIRENAIAIYDENGAVVCYEGTTEDITDQEQAKEHIQGLTHQLLQAQENERQMLSRELHDTVAQELSVAKMACDLIYNERLNGRQPEAQRIQAICEALQKTIADVRNMAYELRPPELEELGLVETVFRLCEEFTQMWGVPVEFQSAGLKNLKLDHDIQINIYRLVQEGLTNIRKHAAASRVAVKLAAAFPKLILRIEDNGRGFDVQKRAAAAGQEKRMGLGSMQERVNLMNGEMKLQSKPGQGTKIAIKLPLEGKKNRAH